jgi:hypothetical protein
MYIHCDLAFWNSLRSRNYTFLWIESGVITMYVKQCVCLKNCLCMGKRSGQLGTVLDDLSKSASRTRKTFSKNKSAVWVNHRIGIIWKVSGKKPSAKSQRSKSRYQKSDKTKSRDAKNRYVKKPTIKKPICQKADILLSFFSRAKSRYAKSRYAKSRRSKSRYVKKPTIKKPICQ